MSDTLWAALIGGFFLALAAILTPVLTPIVQDWVKARREKIDKRTAYREEQATDVVQAMREALEAKDAEIASWKDIAEKRWEMIESWRMQAEGWQRRAEHMDDGWYGQGPRR